MCNLGKIFFNVVGACQRQVVKDGVAGGVSFVQTRATGLGLGLQIDRCMERIRVFICYAKATPSLSESING